MLRLKERSHHRRRKWAAYRAGWEPARRGPRAQPGNCGGVALANRHPARLDQKQGRGKTDGYPSPARPYRRGAQSGTVYLLRGAAPPAMPGLV
eukprot:scaffold14528_cov104-Isochrysis_galbana.AAC.1